MGKIKNKVKIGIGRLTQIFLPWVAAEIDTNRNPERATTLKKLVVYSRTHRAKSQGNTGQLEQALSDFWKGNTGDRFHSAFIDERFKLFLKLHANIIDDLAQETTESETTFSRLVEVGCGDGQVLNYCANRLLDIPGFVGLDINHAAIERAKLTNGSNPNNLAFINGDALAWLDEHPQQGTIILTNGGVLEYFSQPSVVRLFETLAKSLPAAFVLVEPLMPEHDLATDNSSIVFGRENSFSHNYPNLLENAGFSIRSQSDFVHGSTRWIMILAVQ